MKINELNLYLSKLEGPGVVEKLDTQKDTLTMKFCGSVGGPYDDGEIELTFHDVEVLNLPLSMILPVKFEQVNEMKYQDIIGCNYKSADRTLYFIHDDTDCTWHIYAGSYSVKVLPVFWEKT